MPKSSGPRGGPFRLAMGCGCFFLLVMGCFVGYLYWKFNQSVTFDPARIAAVTEEILPGASPLPGQVGLFAVTLDGSRMVVMGDPKLRPESRETATGEVGTTTLSLSQAKPEEMAERLRTEMETRGFRAGDLKVLKKEDASFPVDGRTLSGVRVLMETPEKKELEEFTLVIPGPQGEVLAMFMAPEGRLGPEEVQRFLDGLADLPSPAASPSPAGSP